MTTLLVELKKVIIIVSNINKNAHA